MVSVTNLLWTKDGFRVARVSGVGIVSPVASVIMSVGIGFMKTGPLVLEGATFTAGGGGIAFLAFAML